MVILSDTRTTYYVQGCGLTGLYLPVIQVALISEQTVMQIRLANYCWYLGRQDFDQEIRHPKYRRIRVRI